MDKIKRAIERGELADFLIGKGEYKYWNRELRDPQNWFANQSSLKDALVNIDSDQLTQLSLFGREVKHLFENGYTYDNITRTFVK